MKPFLFFFFFILAITTANAQTETTAVAIPDSSKVSHEKIRKEIIDTQKVVKDTLAIAKKRNDTINEKVTVLNPSNVSFHPIDSFYLKLLNNPFFNSTKPPVYLVISERESHSKDELFYTLSALLIVLAFIKLIFNRYFFNVFKLLFQPSFRQRQTKEQLLQGNVPSFFMNLFFILSGGAFIALLADYYQLSAVSFRSLFLYSATALLILYSAKYITLQFAGWVFNVSTAIDNYIFIVYLINKIIGVLLIPFLLVMAFSSKAIIDISVVIALILIIALFVYRYIISFSPVRKEIKVSISHFFIYIIAIEFLPLLLICKMLIIYLNNSH